MHHRTIIGLALVASLFCHAQEEDPLAESELSLDDESLLPTAVEKPEIIWKKSVSGFDEGEALLKKVRLGHALVIGPINDRKQALGVGRALPTLKQLKIGNDSFHHPSILGSAGEWHESVFPISTFSSGLRLARYGRGLVVLTREDGRGNARFIRELERELALQNAGLRFAGIACETNGKRTGASSLSRGDGCVLLQLDSLAKESVEVTAELRLTDSEGKTNAFTGTEKSEREGRFSVRIPGTFAGYGKMRATLSARTSAKGKSFTLREWTIEWPRRFSLKMPEYRGMVSTARRTADIRLSAAFGEFPAVPCEGRRLAVTVSGPDGKEAARADCRFGSAPTLAFTVPLPREAAPGVYRVTAESTAADGTRIAAEDTFRVVPVRKGQVFIDQDGGLLADGKPWYPFGLYHLANPADINAVADLGIDLAQVWSASAENLKCLRERGIRIALETSAWGQVVNNWSAWRGVVPDRIDFETNAKFREYAERVLAVPEALAFWYTADEAGSGILPGIMRIHDYWQRLDPEDHPTYIVTTGDAGVAPAGEVLALDCYPRSFGAKRPMTDLSDGLESLWKVSPPGRCIVAVPESFGCTAKHRETPEELRCMAYLAMVHGAKGVFWYCWWDPGDQGAHGDPKTREAIKRITTEARVFKLALLAPGFTRLRSPDGRIHACLCGDDSTGRFLIAVNGTDEKSDSVLSAPALSGLVLEPLFGTPAAQVAGETVALALNGCETALFRIKR